MCVRVSGELRDLRADAESLGKEVKEEVEKRESKFQRQNRELSLSRWGLV